MRDPVGSGDIGVHRSSARSGDRLAEKSDLVWKIYSSLATAEPNTVSFAGRGQKPSSSPKNSWGESWDPGSVRAGTLAHSAALRPDQISCPRNGLVTEQRERVAG